MYILIYKSKSLNIHTYIYILIDPIVITLFYLSVKMESVLRCFFILFLINMVSSVKLLNKINKTQKH